MQLLLPALAERGYRIRMVLPDQGSEPAPVDGLPEGAELETVTVAYPGAPRLAAWLLRRPALLGTLVRWYWRALVSKPRLATSELAMTACLIRSAEGVLRGERPAVIHAFDTPWSYGAAAALLARRTGSRSMLSFFGDVLPHEGELEHFDSLSPPFTGVSRMALENVDLAASMTQHCRCLVRHVGFDPDRVALVRVVGSMSRYHPGVDGSSVRARHLPGDDGKLILYVGHIRPRKGPQVLLEALPEIFEGRPGARAVFVGPDYGQQGELEARAVELGVAASVDFVGTVPDEDLPAYYTAADVFVFPTLTTIECLGLTFVQAMFAETPVVATRIAGAPEVIRDGVDGLLVEPSDPAALAARVVELLAMPEETRRALGREGRRRAAELFDEDAVLGDLFGAYDRLLAS